jgi:predicted nuclease of predicted toxin-antitoxin system
VRFLADENCDYAIVRSLRDAGHDVVAVCEVSPRATDPEVIDQCVRENRVLITEDKDFGQLVYASGARATGVVLLRFPADRRAGLLQALLRVIETRGEQLVGRYVVIQPGRARIGGLP